MLLGFSSTTFSFWFSFPFSLSTSSACALQNKSIKYARIRQSFSDLRLRFHPQMFESHQSFSINRDSKNVVIVKIDSKWWRVYNSLVRTTCYDNFFVWFFGDFDPEVGCGLFGRNFFHRKKNETHVSGAGVPLSASVTRYLGCSGVFSSTNKWNVLSFNASNFSTNKWLFSLFTISAVIEFEYEFNVPGTNWNWEFPGCTFRHRLTK